MYESIKAGVQKYWNGLSMGCRILFGILGLTAIAALLRSLLVNRSRAADMEQVAKRAEVKVAANESEGIARAEHAEAEYAVSQAASHEQAAAEAGLRAESAAERAERLRKEIGL